MARPGKPGCNGRELCKERRLQLNRHEGAEETDAVLLKRVESEQITRGPERTLLGHGAAALREAALARCDLRPRDGDRSPGTGIAARGCHAGSRAGSALAGLVCVEHRAGREQQLPRHKPPQGYLSSNTGDLSCSPVISRTPVAAVSPIIFSQCLSVCFCIKHEVKQEVGSCFSVLLGAAFVALFRYTGKICQKSEDFNYLQLLELKWLTLSWKSIVNY